MTWHRFLGLKLTFAVTLTSVSGSNSITTLKETNKVLKSPVEFGMPSFAINMAASTRFLLALVSVVENDLGHLLIIM